MQCAIGKRRNSGMPMRHFLLLISFSLVAGCATTEFDYPKSASFALTDTDDTFLARAFADAISEHPPEQSGFYPVVDAIDSLALRLLLADRAERSIDAQYFLIHDDLVGNLFVRELLRAADRGVRVRLLLDDIHVEGYDIGLAALDAHENFEVRIFNPFGHRKFRSLDVTRVGRITRRMHNKTFIADNQVAIVGGRNIADEYFGARQDEKFSDLDVVGIGSIVPEVSGMFDAYWNHAAAVPMPAIAEAPENADEALARVENKIAKSLQDIESSRYNDAVTSEILEFLQGSKGVLDWSTYDVVYDPPDKVNPDADADAGSIVVQMREAIGQVERELYVVTPYFVLADENVEAFRRLRDRGVSMTVLTNSLASNNHAISHSGYAPVRKRLLEMGIDVYELRASSSIPPDQSAGVQESKITLHAKAFAVDRNRLFIGSFNWNQRSSHLDTESGVIIYSTELAEQLIEVVEAALPLHAFKVFLDEDDKLRWKGQDGGKEVILDHEPQSGFWRRFSAGFLRIAPNSQL